MPNSCVGTPLENELVHGQKNPVMDIGNPAPGLDMLPTTAAFSEPTNGNLLPEKSTQKQSFFLQAEIVRIGAVPLQSPDTSPVIWCLYPELTIIAMAAGDPSLAGYHPEIPNNERRTQTISKGRLIVK